MGRWGDEVSGAVVGIIALVMVGGIILLIVLAGVAVASIVGLAIGGGAAGYRHYKKKQFGPWEEKADATGFGLFEPGGTFLGEEIKWD